MNRDEAQAMIQKALEDMTGPQRFYIVQLAKELAATNKKTKKEETDENENTENGSR